MLLFINGVFFQKHQYLSIGRHPEVVGDAVFINNEMFTHAFFGVCRVKDGRILDGKMRDDFGDSDITSIGFTPDSKKPRAFVYTKKYTQRSDIIRYTFSRKVGGVWIGTYEGHAVGAGVSKCVITKVQDDRFFDPRSTLGIPE